MNNHEKIYRIIFSGVYPLYIQKVERKGRTKEELDEVIMWLTGYNMREIKSQIDKQVTLEEFVNQAPKLNPLRSEITGVICGVKVQDIEDKTTREIRYMDKLVDELAKGKAMEKILRK